MKNIIEVKFKETYWSVIFKNKEVDANEWRQEAVNIAHKFAKKNKIEEIHIFYRNGRLQEKRTYKFIAALPA